MAPVSRSAAICALACLVFTSQAAAGPPGEWTKVANADGITSGMGVARDGNGLLNMLWARESDNTEFNTQLSENAKDVIGPHTVFVYDSPGGGAHGAPRLLRIKGGLRAFFAGLYPNDPHDVGLSTATSSDGVSWAVQPTLASDSRIGMRSPVYVAQGIGGTIFKDGTPFSIWGDSAPNAHGYHVGLSDQTPDVRFAASNASAGGPNAATDSKTGDVAIGWSDLDTGRTLVKFVQQTADFVDMDPWFPPGPQINTPKGRAPDAAERTGMTGRSGNLGGIYIAYLRGDNVFLGRPTVWRVGADDVVPGLPADPGARFPGVVRGPSGRIWAFWARREDNIWRIYGARSNKPVSRFGTAAVIKPPSGTDGVWNLEGEGTAPGGMLDLVAVISRGDNVGYWHQRIRPGISLFYQVQPSGDVLFTTRDAGVALATTITYAGNTKDTGPDGKVVMDGKPGTHFAKATRDGYHPARRSVKVP